jgi:hypothetical protein
MPAQLQEAVISIIKQRLMPNAAQRIKRQSQDSAATKAHRFNAGGDVHDAL